MTSAELKARLPHVWPAFFSVHGRFTETQERAIPIVLDGQDVLLAAPTATGKTEAVVAPLLERHLLAGSSCPIAGLHVLYLCPTRALVRDLFERLRAPLERLGVPLGMKSGDTGPVSSSVPPALLVTTPESLDSLLTRSPRVLATLRALVLDEIHLIDDTPRGDQLRCLLRRVERVRDYHHQETAGKRTEGPPNLRPVRQSTSSVAARTAGPLPSTAIPLQRVALSATVAEPRRVAGRYLHDPVVVEVRGGRQLQAELYPLESLRVLATALAERAAAKTLVFCNSRYEVEQAASYLGRHLGYDAPVFVHYSNLDPALRRRVETEFAAASVAVCVSSSTLELGIDIGTIDEVALLGPPSTPSSFLQRVGRGGRRAETTPVLCLARSPREYLRFQALLNMAYAHMTGAPVPPDRTSSAPGKAFELPPRRYGFRPSVLVQQVFSLLKQSPTGGVRFADVRRVAPDEVSDPTLVEVLEFLTASGHLRSGRPGEWRPGELLSELADAHEIYSNIGGEALGATIVDAYSGRRIARSTRPRLEGETLLMGGRPVEVAWRDRYTFGVNRGERPSEEVLRFRTAPQAVPLDLAQGMAATLGLAPTRLYLLADGARAWLFHFWGDVYGRLLAALLEAQSLASDASTAATATGDPFPAGAPSALRPELGCRVRSAAERHHVRAWNELCLLLPVSVDALPTWDARSATAEARALLPRLTPHLGLGSFHPLLPPDVAVRSALEQIDVPRFETLYRRARVVTAPPERRDELRALL